VGENVPNLMKVSMKIIPNTETPEVYVLGWRTGQQYLPTSVTSINILLEVLASLGKSKSKKVTNYTD
jgi:hypothetical protein